MSHGPSAIGGREAAEGDDALNLRQLLTTLWRRKGIVMGTTLVITSITLLVVVQLTPLYVATTELVVEPPRTNVIDIETVAQSLRPDWQTNETEAAVIGSRVLAEKVVDRLGLMQDPRFNPTLRHEPRGLIERFDPWALVPESWRTALSDLRERLEGDNAREDASEPMSPAEHEAWLRELVIDNYIAWLAVEPHERSRVIAVSYTAADPLLAARLANAAAEAYIDDQIAAKTEQTELANAWLQDRAVELKRAVERAWRVATVPVERRDLVPEIVAFGTVVAGREATLRPLVAGRIVEVGPHFVEGGVVALGELLIAIEPFYLEADLEEAEARIAETEARLQELAAAIEAAARLLENDRLQRDLRQRELARRERLLGTPAGSERAVDEARLALAQAEAQLIAREETLARLAAQAAEAEATLAGLRVARDRARRELADRRLLAPFAGFLADIEGEIGTRVGTGDRVARLIDAARLEARFHLGERDFARLLAGGSPLGREAQVLWTVGAESLAFAATVERIEGEIDAASGGVELFARLEGMGPDTLLRPGAFVTVRIPDRLYRDAVAVPETALHEDAVYTVAEERLVRAPVRVLARDGERVLIATELADGAPIVITRFPEMAPGVKVALD